MIGSLKHKMQLQQARSVPMEGGGYQDNFLFVKEIMAEIKPLRAKELLIAMGSQTQISHKIRIRYDPILVPHMRLVYGQRSFKIHTLINDKEENRFLWLYCLEEWTKNE